MILSKLFILEKLQLLICEMGNNTYYVGLVLSNINLTNLSKTMYWKDTEITQQIMKKR